MSAMQRVFVKAVLGGSTLALLAGLGCAAGADLARRLGETSRRLREVEAQGALRCAPRELAMARSHLEFAELERDRGSLGRAREHLDVADENVRAAAELASPALCGGAAEGPSGG